jgi:hypothetical protein
MAISYQRKRFDSDRGKREKGRLAAWESLAMKVANAVDLTALSIDVQGRMLVLPGGWPTSAPPDNPTRRKSSA